MWKGRVVVWDEGGLSRGVGLGGFWGFGAVVFGGGVAGFFRDGFGGFGEGSRGWEGGRCGAFVGWE